MKRRSYDQQLPVWMLQLNPECLIIFTFGFQISNYTPLVRCCSRGHFKNLYTWSLHADRPIVFLPLNRFYCSSFWMTFHRPLPENQDNKREVKVQKQLTVHLVVFVTAPWWLWCQVKALQRLLSPSQEIREKSNTNSGSQSDPPHSGLRKTLNASPQSEHQVQDS